MYYDDIYREVQEIVVDRSYSLHVNYTSSRPARVTWYHDNVPLSNTPYSPITMGSTGPSSSGYSNYPLDSALHRIRTTDTQSVLTFPKVALKHRGQYKCVVDNGAKSSVEFDVQVKC